MSLEGKQSNTLDYENRSSRTASTTAQLLCLLPGIVGALFIYPLSTLGAVGAKFYLGAWLAMISLSVIAFHTSFRIKNNSLKWWALVINGGWLAICILPPGCLLFIFLIMEAFGIKTFEPSN